MRPVVADKALFQGLFNEISKFKHICGTINETTKNETSGDTRII